VGPLLGFARRLLDHNAMNFSKYSLVLLLLLFSAALFSQTEKTECEDVVYLKGGSIFRGTILEYNADSSLVMRSWSGARLQFPSIGVQRIVQKCKGDKGFKTPFSQRPYSFKEKGWYHATRVAVLAGASGTGIGLQHSTGYKLNRLLGLGLGVGLENFGPYDGVTETYPIFVELRGYLMPKKITPFYALGAGLGLAKKYSESPTWNGGRETWKGGWMVQGQIGYRIGNNAFVHLGIRLQHKTRYWINDWQGIRGTDKILHKRLEIGMGLLL
jgi:hypothetical protein